MLKMLQTLTKTKYIKQWYKHLPLAQYNRGMLHFPNFHMEY